MKKDRSLLFGLLAVSMKKVRPDKLSEVARRTQTSSESDLGKSLVDEGLLSPDDKKKLDKLVEMSLADHDGDASATIQDFGKNPEKLDSLVDSMDDFIAAFEKSSQPPETNADGDGLVDSILGDFSEADSLDGSAPPPDSLVGGEAMLDSLVSESDGAQTRVNQTGGIGDRGSVGDIVGHDAPDSFFESIGSTGTQIMSPVQAAAELDESEIVPAVAEHEGRYETVREFAKGGMGKITLVHDTHLGRDVALKQLLQSHIMPGTQAGAPTTAILTIPIIARFLQEARITGQLEHPAIIPVYELGYRADGSLYYTMKLIRGQSMHDFLKEAETLNDRLPLLTHFLDLCQAISYAHSRGVIHRDLKPMNIMIGEFGETVVIDWGIAKVRGEDDIHARGLEQTVTAMRVSSAEATAKTMYGQTIGSPYFMPAEQAMGRTDLIDERSDVYSLGAVLYTILSGKMPYAGNNVREFMGKVGQVEPKPVRMLEPDVRPELAAICAKAMALVPENRYQSAKELTEEIQKYLSGGQVSAYDYSMVELARKFYRKHKKVLTTAAAFTVVLLASGIFYTINLKFARDAEAKAKVAAVAAQAEAEVARDEAVVSEKKAVVSEKKAVVEKDRAQQQLYYANIAMTRFNIAEQQMAKARELLARCEPADLRHWEWGHLEAESHADMITLDRGGRLSAFTADGTGLLTGTVRGTVSLHDLKTGEILHEYVRRSGNGYAVAISSDAKRLAVRGDAALLVWDVDTKEELLRFDEPKETATRHFMALSANGKYVGALNSDKNTRIWDVDTGKIVTTIEDCQLKGFNLFFSPDGSRLLVARQVFGDSGWERRFEIFSIPDGTQMGLYTIPEDSALSIHTAVFSPDNKRVALGTDNSLLLWNVDTFKQVKEIPNRRYSYLDTIAFSPDGTRIVAGNVDGGILLYTLATDTITEIDKAHEDIIRGIRFSHNGNRIASISDDRTIRLWTVPELRLLHTYRGHDNSIYTLAFSQDDMQMASSTPNDGVTKVWDLSADLEFAPAELNGFKKVVYNPAANLVAGSSKNEVILWNARTGRRIHTLPAHKSAAKVVAFNASGTLLASIGQEGGKEMVRIWDTTSGKLQESFPTNLKDSKRIEFILGDTQILVRSGNILSRLDRTSKTGTPVSSDDAAGKKLKSFNVDAQGTHIVACFEDKNKAYTALLLSLADGNTVASQQVSNVTALRAFFTTEPDQILLTRTDRKENDAIAGGSVYLWNTINNSITEATTLHEGIPIHAAEMLSAAFSDDGTRFATGDGNGDIAIWKIHDGTIEYQLTLRGHAGGIKAMAFSPNGKRIVTGSADKSFKIWDPATGRQILTLNAAAVKANLQIAQPTQVAFSADGLHLATLTEPPVSPMILHAFSTNMADYPDISADENAKGTESEKALAHLEKQMEAYKRQYWRE